MKKKLSQIEKLKSKFYFVNGEPELKSYGIYRMGLTQGEILFYIQARAGKINVKKLFNKFHDIAGCNTMASAPDGQGLMYRHDVQRYADVLFGKTACTYFD